MKLAILLGSAVVVWGLIAYVFFAGNSPAKKAPEVAKTALYASVDCPESVRIVAVSKPDSVSDATISAMTRKWLSPCR